MLKFIPKPPSDNSMTSNVIMIDISQESTNLTEIRNLAAVYTNTHRNERPNEKIRNNV